MKVLGVVLGALVAAACGNDSAGVDDPNGAPGAPGDVVPEPELGEAASASAYQILCGDRGDQGQQGPAAVAVLRAIGRGAGRLASLQADTIGDNAQNGLTDNDPDDGGWDFTLPATAAAHTAAASPPNLYGETGFGLWAAIDAEVAGSRTITAALDTGTGMQRNPDIDSPPDFAFAVLLAQEADNAGFATLGRERYDARLAAGGGAAAFGAFIRDARDTRNEAGLIAYDLGWLMISASALDARFPGAGYDDDAETFARIVVDDLTAANPRFNPENTAEGSYIIGLAWSQVAASFVDNRALFAQLRTRLLQQQHANGTWGTSSTQPADDLQSTAIALETIALTGRDSVQTRRAVARTVEFLLGTQAVSGGWADSTGTELPLVDAEVVLGLALSRHQDGLDALSPTAARAAVVTGPAKPGRASPSN